MKLLEPCTKCGKIVEVPFTRLLDKEYRPVCKACVVKSRRAQLRVVSKFDEFRRLKGTESGKKEFRLATVIQWARSHRNFVRRSTLAEYPVLELKALRDLCLDTARLIDEHLAVRPA